MQRLSDAAKRLFDIVLSAAGILLCLPLILVICLAIKCNSRGPVLFSQPRLGQGGRHFTLYKFRKFHHGRPPGPAVTATNDDRMTAVGRLLQRSKLDELPQLWNVLRGDMSVVGPRPETIGFSDCFRNGLEQVLLYKPGIFGPNQVFFRNEGDLFTRQVDPEAFYRDVLFDLKARVDLKYYPNANVFLDLLWIIRGLVVVFLPSAAPQSDIGLLGVERWVAAQDADNFETPIAKEAA